MHDGIHACGMCGIGEEIAAHDRLVELPVGIIDLRSHQRLQLLAQFRGSVHQALGLAVAVVAGHAQLLRQNVADIRLAAADTSRDADSHSPSVCSIRYCTWSGVIFTLDTPSGTERKCRCSMESGCERSSS